MDEIVIQQASIEPVLTTRCIIFLKPNASWNITWVLSWYYSKFRGPNIFAFWDEIKTRLMINENSHNMLKKISSLANLFIIHWIINCSSRLEQTIPFAGSIAGHVSYGYRQLFKAQTYDIDTFSKVWTGNPQPVIKEMMKYQVAIVCKVLKKYILIYLWIIAL